MLRRLDVQTRAWAVVAGASVGRLALGFVASVMIARSLGASDFGVYALLGTVGSVVGVLGDPGLTQAGVKRIASTWPEDLVRAGERARVFFWLRLGAMLPLIPLCNHPADVNMRWILPRAGIFIICGAVVAFDAYRRWLKTDFA